MVEDVRIIDWIMGTTLGALGIAIKWVMGDMKLNISQNKTAIEQLAKEHAQYQLYVANHYPGEDTVKRMWATLEKVANDVNDLKVMIAKKNH